MKRIMKNIKHNLNFIFSSICLFIFLINPFELSLLFTGTFVALILFFSSISKLEFNFKLSSEIRKFIDVIAYLILIILFVKFKISWPMTNIIITLSNILDISREFITYLFGIILFFFSVKFTREVMRYIVYSVLKLVEENIKIKNFRHAISNIKENILIIISALAYFCYEIRFEINFLIGIFASLLLLCLILSQINNLKKFVKEKKMILKFIATLATLGICIYGQNSLLLILKDNLSIDLNVSIVVSMICSIISAWFVYVLMLYVWNSVFKIIESSKIFNNITKNEKIIYAILLLVNIIFVIIVFNLTDGFYGTDYKYDFIYTSDSPSIIRDNAYLSLTYLENDIRQPLFAVFASPFIGIPYFISKVLSFNYTAYAILINVFQIIMLAFSNYLLANLLNLSSKNRIWFIILINCTYTHLLSILMMEQYVISYFWLILFFYCKLKLKEDNKLTLLASGGSLLTSFWIIPFFGKKNVLKDTKNWLIEMIKYVIIFITFLLVFGRLDLFFNLNSTLEKLNYFTGKEVLFKDQFYQYFAFLSNLFIKPNAGENISIFGDVSWQLNPAITLNIFGLLVFIIALISLYVNRKNKTSLIAGIWVLLSLVMLLVLGWGTRENGLVLYSLYFGWSFFILLFQLLEKLEKITKNKNVISLSSLLLIGILLYINIPAIYELITFSIEKFPL